MHTLRKKPLTSYTSSPIISRQRSRLTASSLTCARVHTATPPAASSESLAGADDSADDDKDDAEAEAVGVDLSSDCEAAAL